MIAQIMGQTLSEPVTVKRTTSCSDKNFLVGSSCMQGWRIKMEDAHITRLSLPTDKNAVYFGVFDGHGGKDVAEHVKDLLHSYISHRQEYKDGDIAEAMRQAFLEMDEALSTNEEIRGESCGSTAITVIIKDDELYCANLGDSRAVACINGKAEPLSIDHKPENREEFERIKAAGGWVDCGRVNGNLALSRAFGDFVFKKNSDKKQEQQIVSALPDVTVKKITEDWEFIVLACDGIWDVMENSEVVNFVRKRILLEQQPDEICKDLIERCLAPDLDMTGLGCDNMTVIIVAFLHGGSYWNLISKCHKNSTNDYDSPDEEFFHEECSDENETNGSHDEIGDTTNDEVSAAVK